MRLLKYNYSIKGRGYEVAGFTTAYDFMVILPDPSSNFQLVHENISVAALGI